MLIECRFKIFTNLILNRLSKVITKIIDRGQTTFIKGRYILDGVVILHETLHELWRRKQKGIIFKIDFEKAYDSVSWNFVEEVLKKKGFDDQIVRRIMSTVRGRKVCINIK